MNQRRRSEVEVAYAILSAIRENEQTFASQPRKTRVQASVYLSWKALNRHIEKLRENGLLSTDGLRITQLGLQFIQHYRNFKPLLDEYGY